MSGREDRAQEILEAAVKRGNAPRCKRLLATIYLRQDPRAAEELYAQPKNIWEYVYLGDIRYYFLKDIGGALESWQSALDQVDWSTAREWDNPARHLLKRLYRFTKDPEILETWASLDVDNFKQAEIADYAKLLHQRGDDKRAQEIIDAGLYLYRADPLLLSVAKELGLEVRHYPKKHVQASDAVRQPYKTGLLSEATDPEVLVKAVRELHPDAVITLASSVLTIMEGTLLWAGTFKPCWLARKLGPLSEHAKGPLVHYYTYPIVGDWKVHAYIELSGTIPVLVGAAAAAVGRVFGRRGWFYRIVGPVAKAVDSDKIVPYDACLVPGPLNGGEFCKRLCSQGVKLAIVDVNSLFGAEVVHCCEELDKNWIIKALSDNPAGNDESMTPIVLLWREPNIPYESV
ncbi:hypothetical protein HPY42_05570 [Coprothermobacteraceae bacterium]|nr:hypothetical protein [Coprothermobacteraceae bacterium]